MKILPYGFGISVALYALSLLHCAGQIVPAEQYHDASVQQDTITQDIIPQDTTQPQEKDESTQRPETSNNEPNASETNDEPLTPDTPPQDTTPSDGSSGEEWSTERSFEPTQEANNEPPTPDTQEPSTPDTTLPPERITCPKARTECGGVCVDTNTDDQHCGGCNKACNAPLSCVQGGCKRTSKLWGKAGEHFTPADRFFDWSYAGYAYGEAPLPTKKPDKKITDFGAVANDNKDDTSAFEKAIQALGGKGGTIRVPAGTFILQKRLRLPSHTVLQGKGSNKTILSVPKSLTDVYGNKGLSGGGTSSYAFSGGFIEVRGSSPVRSSNLLAKVVSNAKQGSKQLKVDDASKFKAKQWVLLIQTDTKGSLIDALHSQLMKGGTDNVGDRWSFPNRVVSIQGNNITFERPLPLDIKTTWKPTFYTFSGMATQVGIEGMTIRFPKTKYPGHFKEKGYNAIDFSKVYQCWVRDVKIEHADYGVNFRESYHSTATGVTIRSSRPSSSLHGHHAISIGHGGGNLIINFDIGATLVHDITVEWYTTGNVITKGKGKNLRMDHHRAAPFRTLWTEVDLGTGKNAFTSGGRKDRGPHTASYSTFWNLKASSTVSLPSNEYGSQMTFIGFPTSASKPPSKYDWWLEAIKPSQLGPKNLWEAMLLRRIGRTSP
ncbi:MAG: hypothetical protein CL920_06130 [Deltaproteobacteria bacterium]|nr:hypothetical protein [Deltaproteobacteria bacterium]MBU48257.1 hypothetical protein [Deltaproteobacteria bacterium]|tara:strand:- start:15760 stop:17742 length:1983 start_codon:yes stop_codon:yes gene_type:complete